MEIDKENSTFECIKFKKKEVTLKDIEKAMKSVGLPEYPKYLGNEVWELDKGVYGNERTAEELNKAIVEQVKRDNEPFKSNVAPVMVDLEVMKILFKKDDK